MEILKNQTIFKCSYCGKRLLSKKGCILHEKKYCKNDESPNVQEFKALQKNCKHEKIGTEYSYIPGEAVKEPYCDFCIDCGLRL